MSKFNELFQSALAKLTQTPVVSKARNVLESAKQGYSSLKQNTNQAWGRVKTAVKNDPLQFTPVGFFQEAPEQAGQFLNWASGSKTDNPEQFIRGAVDPFNIAHSVSNKLRPQYSSLSTPQTQTSKNYRIAGQTASGLAMTFPVGGWSGVGSRAVQGALLGGGLKAGGNVLTGKPILQDVDKGAWEGVQNSWKLAFTNIASDKIATKYFPQLADKAIGEAPTLWGNLQNVFLRALLESPVENTFFTTLNKLNGDEKRNFVKAWIENLPGEIAGNLLFATFQGGKMTWDDPKIRNGAKKAFSKALETMKDERGYIDFSQFTPKTEGDKAVLDYIKKADIDQQKLKGEADIAKQTRALFSSDELKDIAKLKNLMSFSKYANGDIETLRASKNKDLVNRIVETVRGVRPDIVDDSEALDFALNIPALKNTKVKRPENLDELKAYIKKQQAEQMLDMKGFRAKRGVGSYSSDPKVDNPLLPDPYKYEPLPWEEEPKMKGEFRKRYDAFFNPIKNVDPETAGAVEKWHTGLLKTKQASDTIADHFKNIPLDDGWKIIKYMENPTAKQAELLDFDVKKNQIYMDDLRKYYDTFRQKGIDDGLDIAYLDNYMNHVWKESPEEIDAIVGGLGTRPAWSKKRQIPTIEEGMKLGLTPEFTHPSQLAGHYANQLGKARANKELANLLIRNKMIIPMDEAPINWQVINAPFFPTSTKTVNGEVVVMPYKASPDTAKLLNNIFGEQKPGLLKYTSDLSRVMQEMTLSGGIPGTPVNAFTLGNLIKEFTAFRFKGPVQAFGNSFSEKATRNFFSRNRDYMKMMSQEGIDVRGSDYESLFKNLEEKLDWRQTIGNGWEKVMSEPTFKRFLPQLNVSFFKDTYDGFIKQGMSKPEAQKLAGDVTKKFYGLETTLGRSNTTTDALNSVFFAPRFREGMINFWKNNFGSLRPKNLGNKAYSSNRKFMAGVVVTYGLYNALNKKLNDRWMWENKPGKEFYLEIPTKNPKQRSIFIPMLPSIGTIPRKAYEMVRAGSEGDIRGVTQKATGFLSQPLSLTGQVLTNRNYFGGNIADYDDDTLTKMKKLVGYTVGEVTHPFIAEPLAVMQGRRTVPEAVLLMMELPTYPSKATIYVRKDNQEVYEKLVKAGKDENKVKKFIQYQQDLDDLSSVEYKKMANNLVAKGKDPEKVLEYVTQLSEKADLEKQIRKIRDDKDLTLDEKKKKALPLVKKLKKLQ